jgi:hypothetical protein
MSYFPTPFGHLSDWRVDARDPRPSARDQALALAKKTLKERR